MEKKAKARELLQCCLRQSERGAAAACLRLAAEKLQIKELRFRWSIFSIHEAALELLERSEKCVK